VPDPALAAGQKRLDAWNFVNLERIGAQVSRPLLPVFLIAAPHNIVNAVQTQAVEAQPAGIGSQTVVAEPVVAEPNGLKRVLPVYDLSEGPHESYALQWFAFALTLGLGYPFYVRKQLRQSHSRK
jgi:surfeit locus 1 family protein